MITSFLIACLVFIVATVSLPSNDTLPAYNLNVAIGTSNPLDYTATRPITNRPYTASPENWRKLSCYTIMLDRFVDGDPSNNDFFKTKVEFDTRETHFRAGGDVVGLRRAIPYLTGMGVTCLYLAGTPFVNMPWGADGYSPLDFTLMDPHYGTVQEWRDTIDLLHDNGIYIILDFTVGTMGDLINFKGYESTSAPLVNVTLDEYEFTWKKTSAILDYAPWGLTEYRDFTWSNEINDTCRLPTFWNSNGTVLEQANVVDHVGCKISDFDGYGDMESLGIHPDWERQLGKFMSVQDRLREWNHDVNDKLQVYPCLAITALDFDGIRIDKSVQVTVEGLARWAKGTRECAASHNKTNFLISGEVVDGNTVGALYYGRGRDATQRLTNATDALTPSTDASDYIRTSDYAALDSVAFHYSVYRSLIPFLGLDGNPFPEYDATGLSFATIWNDMLLSNDFINPADGTFDPKHLYGASNFDVFRWPALTQGRERQMLATIITAVVMPGIPLYYYGEEQGMYLFDNDADDFLYGRQPMFSNTAWRKSGCYTLGSQDIVDFPLERGLTGCQDEWNDLDHFDVTAETRRVWKRINQIRSTYPVLTDGFSLTQNGQWTVSEAPTTRDVIRENGLWSVIRDWLPSVNPQTTSVWILYSNRNVSTEYTFDCANNDRYMSPYPEGTSIRNLFYPYNQIAVGTNGCIDSLNVPAYGFMAFLPAANWTAPLPSVTKFTPGHDTRVLSNGTTDQRFLNISFEFDTVMDCNSVSNSITINSTTEGSVVPFVNTASILCASIEVPDSDYIISATSHSVWRWSATLLNANDGIYQLTMKAPSAATGNSTTDSTDSFLIRKGLSTNPMVYPSYDYSNDLLYCTDLSDCSIDNSFAAGADKWRYSFNYGGNWSDWAPYEETFNTSSSTPLTGNWDGIHVMVQYWSALTNSATSVVHGDAIYTGSERRNPSYLARGKFNNWGLDAGLTMNLENDDLNDGWTLALMTQWPASIQLNVFGYDDYFYGDPRGNSLAQRLPPNSLSPNFFNLTVPPHPYVGWTFHLNDENSQWWLTPRGSATRSIVIFVLFALLPLLGGILSILIFTNTFYSIKVNLYGNDPKGLRWWRRIRWVHVAKERFAAGIEGFTRGPPSDLRPTRSAFNITSQSTIDFPGPVTVGFSEASNRRKVLIATLEYEILGWNIKVRIGGLGVMTSMMARCMSDVDLIWVIPKVSGITYPKATPKPPINVTIFGKAYLVDVEEYVYNNLTYVLLDSPVFLAQNPQNPYPARMDELSSAIYYSTWNQSIAAVYNRFPIDIYHINDYHGGIAPLYLLPRVIPVVVSLHNADFQGSWPLRNQVEILEVCSAFNLSEEITTKYVRFGNTFNLLHAAASFVSIHQRSIGVAGVSEKYGKRSWARYPALWTLKSIEALPNPDPSDMADLDKQLSKSPKKGNVEAEKERPSNKRKAQEWAKLIVDPNAELMVFVGRWSKQKGVDLIADAMVSLLQEHKAIQLICIGPIVDIYGRFAASKLARLMELYPGRVCSIPRFTLIPPEINAGADFALIPSRDEPFGLVAVEFGRQGALGIGSRLGGLGLMPGWWYPVESDSTAHMLSQFSKTIKLAMKSTQEERAILRARSAVQRFPVLVWRQRLDSFHARAISANSEISNRQSVIMLPSALTSLFDVSSWKNGVAPETPPISRRPSFTGGSPPSSPPSTPMFGSSPTMSPQPTSSSMSVEDFHRNTHSQPTSIMMRSPPGSPPETPMIGSLPMMASMSAEDLHRNIHSRPTSIMFSLPNTTMPDMPRGESSNSLGNILEENQHSSLKVTDETFNDEDGLTEEAFVSSLKYLSSSNSTNNLCIQKVIEQGEKAHFKEKHRQKLDPVESDRSAALRAKHTRVQRFMQRRIGDWPVYSIFISLGQVLASTALQLTLLSGKNSQTAVDIYSNGGIFLGGTLIWWWLFRSAPSIWVLVVPWFFFTFAFFLVGISALVPTLVVSQRLMQAAILLYAFASSAGVFFFSLNFGEEAGSATAAWVIRSLIVQSIQQVWVALLWFWGHTYNGTDPSDFHAPKWLLGIAFPLMIVCAICGRMLYAGLPMYYWQSPAEIPSLWKTLFRRRLVIWFLIAEILKDYWLSTQYGRSWAFVWDFLDVPLVYTAMVTVAAFLVVLPAILAGLYFVSRTHTWALPMFSVGLGTPRWCQTFWATSGIGSYLPWAGAAGPYISVLLWLWLGVLDSVQGVGIGIMLLQTLSRVHVAAALFALQIVGATTVLIAHASAPHKLSPFSVFPNVAMWATEGGIANKASEVPFFWLALVCQIVATTGYFVFYRKDQLSKP